jgi:prepilin-type N-terminal cleavage/methylation domain-containing protein
MRGFNPNSNKGFSIIELMIVVAIVGILAAVAVPSYLKHVHRTRQAEGVHRLLDVKTAQEKYYALNDTYFNGDPLSGTGDAEFTGMLNFDVTDTAFHDFGIVGTVTGFTIELFSDLNEDGESQMCWSINDSETEPSRISVAVSGLGGDCVAGGAAEELGFSTMLF